MDEAAKLIIELRNYADIAEAGGKPHWAKTMRDAAIVLKIFDSSEGIARHFNCAESDLHVCHQCDGFGVHP